MKKTIIKILSSLIALILCAVIVFVISFFLYYPHYQKHKKSYDIKADPSEIKVMSCNVRCLNPLDFGKKNWFYRADLLLETINNAAPGIIGFQEVTKWQYKYLCNSLTNYDSVITYRDKTPNSEGCPVFYNSDVYSLIDKGTFWLSETPDEMSKDWGAACYRVCSYTILKTKETGKEFVVFNTHLDHVSEEARINGINLVLEKIKEFDSRPAVLMGDLNARPGTTTYNAAIEVFDDAALMTDDTMSDSCTYQNFGKELDRERIDYFMISKDTFNVNYYKVVKDVYDGIYTSDHFQILISLSFTD